MTASAGDTLKGAAGGAVTGASIGSVAGPYGALIGGAIGGVGGGLLSYFGGSSAEDEQKQLDEYRQKVLGRGVPQTNAAQANISDFRGNQQELVKRLEALSNGTGPSLVGEQLKAATDRNSAQQQAIANSGRGNMTLSNLLAANNSAQLGQGAAQQAAIGRLAEEQAANSQLSTTLQGARGADEQLAQFNAQQKNFAAQANLEAKLRAMGLSDSSILSILQQMSVNANKPSTGDQLLAGGVGALGMYASNQGKANIGTSGAVQTRPNIQAIA